MTLAVDRAVKPQHNQSDVNAILSERLFLHVAAQIYILLIDSFDGAIVQAKIIPCVYCSPTEPLYPNP